MCEDIITKIKLQMNEHDRHETSFHVNNNSQLQIVQPELTN